MENVILAPGLLCDERLFAVQTEALRNRARFSVPSISNFESIEDMATALLSTAPPRFALGGFSMGGHVAIETAARAPERVIRLALLSTNHHAVSANVRAHLSGSIERLSRGDLEGYIDDAYPLYVAPEQKDNAELKATFKAMAMAQGAAAAIRQIRAILSFDGQASTLTKIACPTAVICGALDQRNPLAVHQEMAAAIPHSTLVIVEGSGHFAPIEKPDAVTAAFEEWLDTC